MNKETAKSIMGCVKQFPINEDIEYFIFHPNYKIQRVSKDKKGNGVYMTRSNSLNEKPLNFIIKKITLKELEEQSIEACKK